MDSISFVRPSSLNAWLYNTKDFVKNWIGTGGRSEQTLAMSIGSGFDSLVKGDLITDLGNPDGMIFADQQFRESVYFPNQAIIRPEAELLLSKYKECGAYSELLGYLKESDIVPRFENKLRRDITFNGSTVRLGGTPDIYYTNGNPKLLVVFDFKVRGYYSSAKQSPKKGFYQDFPGRNMYNYGKIGEINGIKYCDTFKFDEVDENWARQMTMYAWMLGVPVTQPYLIVLHELLCDRTNFTNNKPDLKLRVAEHRSVVSPIFHEKTFYSCKQMQYCIDNDHWFLEMNKKDSQARVEMIKGSRDFKDGW